MRQYDETFERAMQFVKNSQTIHPGVSNLYVFTSTDKDGNIVDEKYGMNLMTNNGFKAVYQDNESFEASNSIKLYVGSGVSTNPGIRVEDTSLEIPCFSGLAATNQNTTKNFTYPLYYAESDQPNQGLITLISRFLICYYPENISGFPDQVRIDEYGIGKAWNNIWTHSHTYNIKGERASIYKTPNTKLTITVYMCLSLNESIIINGWASNRYTAITTNAIMYHRMFETYIKTYKRDDIVYNRQTYNYNDGYHNITNTGGTYENSTTLAPVVVTDGSNPESAYIDGFIYQTDGFMIVEPQYLDVPENITLTNFYSKTPYEYQGFSDKFGTYPRNSYGNIEPGQYTKEQWPSITRLRSASAYLFDWKTGQWDNQLSVYNPGARVYSDTPAQTNCALPLTYYGNGTYITAYLHQNVDPSDPIVAIKSNAVSITLYATNKYWDKSTWIPITNKRNIPSNARNCRYWITDDNVAANKIEFQRESDVFQLLERGGSTPSDNGFMTYEGIAYEKGVTSQCDGSGWYMRGNKLYTPINQTTYTIGNSGDTESMTYGKYLVTFNSVNNKILVTDVSNATTTNPIPATTEMTINWGSGVNVNSYSDCYRTETGTGIICMQSLKSGVEQCAIIDLRDPSGVVITMESWSNSCAIWGTNKLAYVPSGVQEIHVYNVQSQSDDGSAIPFPTGISSIPLMFGHSKYVWFTNGSNYSYFVDITSVARTPEACDNVILYTSNRHMIKITNVDDVFIIYRKDEAGKNNVQKAHYVLLTNPSHPISMTDFEYNHDYLGTRIDFILRYVQKYTSGNVQHGALMLVIARHYSSGSYIGAQNQVVDFGQYLTTGTVVRWVNYQWDVSGIILYGDNIIWNTRVKSPAINWMPIRLVGTTDTITTMNAIKNITNKQYFISYTNQPSWGDGSANSKGIPPGEPLAITDDTGDIIGWQDL